VTRTFEPMVMAAWDMARSKRWRNPTSEPMVAKRIIPCLDVADGRVVKGVNFVGLRDRDLTAIEYTSKGASIRLRFTFDETTLGFPATGGDASAPAAGSAAGGANGPQ
jgi:hypothetical protein